MVQTKSVITAPALRGGTVLTDADVASVTINGTPNYYSTIADAISAAQNSTGDVTITILKDISISDKNTQRFDFRTNKKPDAENSTITIQGQLDALGNRPVITKTGTSFDNSPIIGYKIVLKDIVFDGNKSATFTEGPRVATNGGAIKIESGAYPNSSLELNNASVINNRIRKGSHDSGASDGTDGMKGGGIYATGSSTTVTLKNGSEVSGNEAYWQGGGIYCEGSITLEDTSKVTGNVVGTNASQTGKVKGGGIYVGTSGKVCIKDSVQITVNTEKKASQETTDNLYIPTGSNQTETLYVTGNLTSPASFGVTLEGVIPAKGVRFAHAQNSATGTEFIFADVNSDYSAVVDASGNIVGYAINCSSMEGYDGEIALSVGFDTEGTVIGISFTTLTETAGMGMLVDTDDWKAQFANVKVDSFTLNKAGGSTADNEIDSVSGASTTSGAVVNAVNAAIDFYNNYLIAG